MARPLRIDFPGAVYHVTSRGCRREPIVLGDEIARTCWAFWARRCIGGMHALWHRA